jgi:hypothetical protein
MKDGQYIIKLPASPEWRDLYPRLTYGFGKDRPVSLFPQPGCVEITGTDGHIDVYKECLDFANENGLDPGQIKGDIPTGYRPFRFRFRRKAANELRGLLNALRDGRNPFDSMSDELKHLWFITPDEFVYYGSHEGYCRLYNIFFNWCKDRGSDAYSDIEVGAKWPKIKHSNKPVELTPPGPEGTLDEEYLFSIEPRPEHLRPIIFYGAHCAAREETRWFQRGLRKLSLLGGISPTPSTKEFNLPVGREDIKHIAEGLSKHLNIDSPYHMKTVVTFRPAGMIKEKRSTGDSFTATPDILADYIQRLIKKIEQKERKGRKIVEQSPPENAE